MNVAHGEGLLGIRQCELPARVGSRSPGAHRRQTSRDASVRLLGL